MINHLQVLYAIRTKLLTLSVCSSGAVQLSATQAAGVSGYARAAGSFLTDGFVLGQEVLAAGFGTAANNGVSVITDLNPNGLAMTVSKTPATVVEAAGARTLSVGLPLTRVWTQKPLAPTAIVPGVPYLEEGYVRGSAKLQTVGPSGRIFGLPLYLVRLYAADSIGLECLSKYADAVVTLFAPKTAFALTNGDTLRVRGDLAPYAEEIFPDQPGWSVLPVTVPLFVETTNAL